MLIVQKSIRGHLARRRHQPRIKGIAKIKLIKKSINQTEQVANQLKSEKESMLQQVKEIYLLIDNSVNKIKSDPKITPAAIDAMYAEIMKKVDKETAALKKKLEEQRNAEEQERLRKIQMALEAERKAKEEEERLIREEAEDRKK